MGLRNTPVAWGWPARALHWAVAVMILGLLSVGTYMAEFEPDLIARLELTQTHKSLGFVTFWLALLRIGWRLANRRVPAQPPMPGWQARAARGSHIALYVLTIAMPLSGWLMATSSPLGDPGAVPMRIPNRVFDLFEMPDPFATGSAPLSAAFGTLHAGLAILLALILLVHVGAALKHHLIDRDTVLRRMTIGQP